jgi:hypothetical protein
MNNQNSDDTNSDIVAPMNQAFENGNFYGLEYVLDELVKKVRLLKINRQ